MHLVFCCSKHRVAEPNTRQDLGHLHHPRNPPHPILVVSHMIFMYVYVVFFFFFIFSNKTVRPSVRPICAAETGLEILHELLMNVGRTPAVAQGFYRQFLLSLVQVFLFFISLCYVNLFTKYGACSSVPGINLFFVLLFVVVYVVCSCCQDHCVVCVFWYVYS